MTQTPPASRTIDIVSDVICPWCYVGRAQLAQALAVLDAEGMTIAVRWNPFQLNPDMPRDGIERTTYRLRKFGTLERSRALDAQVAEAAAAVGLTIRHDLMMRTPNTVDAHRLIRFARMHGAEDAVVGALFGAYFEEGRDIGDTGTLVAIAGESGLDATAAQHVLQGNEIRVEVLALDRQVREAGVSGVPSFFLDGHGMLSGAAGAEAIVAAVRRGDQMLRERDRTAA